MDQTDIETSDNYQGEERREIKDHAEYFDSLVQAKPLEIPINKFRCSNLKDVMLVTTVGTGIGICMHDPHIGAGGLGHVFLPKELRDEFPHFTEETADLRRYYENIITTMITTLIQLGGERSKIRVKLFGGGDVDLDSDNDDGRKMYIFVKECLVRNGVNIANEDIGSAMGRRIQYIPVSGKGMRRLLKRESDLRELKAIEDSYDAKTSSE